MTLIGSWLVHCVVGSQYAWGSISPYIVSYFRNKGVDATDSQFYAVLPLIIVVSTLFFPLGMTMSSKLGSRKVILIGGCILVGVTLLTSWLTYVVVFFAVWACGFGVAKGSLYPAPLRASWSHLPGRKGMVTGVIVSGLGFGSFVYGIVVNKLVNPDNLGRIQDSMDPDVKEFPTEVTDRVPRCLLILAICWSV
jgi:OFA family oxalate/formate antiporter-like MFS transporter